MTEQIKNNKQDHRNDTVVTSANINATHGKVSEADHWDDPIPLLPLIEVPSFNNDLIPRVWLGWIEDCSKRIGCPIEMIFINALSAFGIMCGLLFNVQPKKYDTGWKAFLTQLWSMIVAPSGSKKSPAMSAAFDPLSNYERQLHQEYVTERRKNESEIDELKKKIKNLNRKIAEGDFECAEIHERRITFKDSPDVLKEIIAIAPLEDTQRQNETTEKRREDIQNESQELEKRLAEIDYKEPRLLTQEATIQAICVLLQTNHLGIGLTLDELTSFFTGLERDNRQTDRAFYLSAWSGNQSYTSDTVSRGNIRVENLAISITGSIQPKVFQSYCHEQIKKKSYADGLLARFQLIAQPEPKKCIGEDKSPDIEARGRYYKSFFEIGQLRTKKNKEGYQFAPTTYCFDSDAQEIFDKHLEELEGLIEESSDHELYHDFLAKQRSTMPLLAMLIHVIEISSSGTSQAIQKRLEFDIKISVNCARQAVNICRWIRANTKSLYCPNQNPANLCARQILKKAKEHNLEGITAAELLSKKWSGITDTLVVHTAIELLTEHKYLKRVVLRTNGRARNQIHWNPRYTESMSSEVQNEKN